MNLGLWSFEESWQEEFITVRVIESPAIDEKRMWGKEMIWSPGF